jgi:hypothetical protein
MNDLNDKMQPKKIKTKFKKFLHENIFRHAKKLGELLPKNSSTTSLIKKKHKNESSKTNNKLK